MKKYVATNGKVYIKALSLQSLSNKLEKYLIKQAKQRLEEELDINIIDRYYEVFQISYFTNQIELTELGVQDITLKGMYKYKKEIAMWNLTRTFEISKRW